MTPTVHCSMTVKENVFRLELYHLDDDVLVLEVEVLHMLNVVVAAVQMVVLIRYWLDLLQLKEENYRHRKFNVFSEIISLILTCWLRKWQMNRW